MRDGMKRSIRHGALAHQVADSVYEKILGVRGAFWTRIAYVTASGTGNNRHYQLMVADSDPPAVRAAHAVR